MTTQLSYGPFISRAQAKEQGLTYYFSGKPCAAGHQSVRNVSDYGCKQCRELRKIERRNLGVDAERSRQYTRDYRAADPERDLKQQRAHDARRAADPAKRAHRNALNQARYCPEKSRASKLRNIAQRRNHERNRYATDLDYKLTKCLRARLNAIVSRGMGAKTGSTFDLLACSLDELRTHLEVQFTDEMTWENFGEWHIDHIRPCASFELKDPKQQRECFHFTNLQPLWAEDNLRKSDKWEPVAA